MQHVESTAPGNSGPAAGDTWALLDRLGSTVALSGDTGLLDELTDYSDWGQQTFETPGWNTQVGYTGELADANWGDNQYYARHYDPSTGSWLSQDPYRGQLTAPQTLQRYQFVETNPTTNQDLLGYSVDRGQTAVKAANTGNGGTKASKAGVKNAAAASRPTARHPNFGPIKTVLEAISFGLGILGFIPGPQQPVLLALSSILGGVSAFLGCLETGINADCLINVAFALLPGPIFKLAKPFKATVAKVFRDTFAQFKNLFKKPPKPQIKPKQSK